MNKNLFIYSFKYLAVLIALVTFSSCEREEFTEEDADNLAAAREQRAEDRRDAEFQRNMDSVQMQRAIDSLRQANAGGKVFYTVNVVPGGSTAFSQGRFEEVEGIDGATVTVTNPVTGQIMQQTTTAGIATFELYSGEVTVNVEAPNHTDVNYVSNLTPTGGIPNGSTAYVGNVIPVFDDPNNPGADAIADGNFATIEGAAFAETDITFGNDIEETVPDGTRVAAYIDVTNTNFLNEYIREANNNNSFNPINGNPSINAQPGVIQRVAYEEASTFGTTATTALGDDANEGGVYNLTVAATASGLPIQLQYSDFVANRTYFATDEDSGPITKRFLYTQATIAGGSADPSTIGITGNLRRGTTGNINFSFAQTEASATAALTGGDNIQTVQGPAVTVGGTQFNQYLATGTAFPNATATGNAVDATDGTIADGTNSVTVPSLAGLNAYLGNNNRGSYLQSPTVVFPAPAAGGVQATGIAILGEPGTGLANPTNELRPVIAVLVTNAGSGYTDDPATTLDDIQVTFERQSITGKDGSGVPVPNGIGTVINTQSGIGFVEVDNSGFGYSPAGAGPNFTGVGTSTGVAPRAVFNNQGDTQGQTPTGGTAPTATVVVDRGTAAAPGSGTVSQVDITGAGSGFTTPEVTIINGTPIELTDADLANFGSTPTANPAAAGGSAVILFETDGTGGVRFSDDDAGGSTTLAVGTTEGLNLPQGPANNFALVPSVVVNGTATNANTVAAPSVGATTPTNPELEATVDNNGQLVSIRITNPGSGFDANADRQVGGLTVTVTPVQPRATATAFLSTGGGITNYVLNNVGTPRTIYRNLITGAPVSGSFDFITAGNTVTQTTITGATGANNTNNVTLAAGQTLTISNDGTSTGQVNVTDAAVANITAGNSQTFNTAGTYDITTSGGAVTFNVTTTGTTTGFTGGTTNTIVTQFSDENGNLVARGSIGASSDYRVAFAPPAAGGQAASGFPVFEANNSGELVGIVITNIGSGYAANETPNFWVIPNGLSLTEYAAGTTTTAGNQDNARVAAANLSPQVLTITFTDGGSGYAVRPEFVIDGGNRSVEDLASLNAAINNGGTIAGALLPNGTTSASVTVSATQSVRSRLAFNGEGSITNSSLSINLPQGAFTAAGLAAEPITLTLSTNRLASLFNTEVNGGTGFGLTSATFNGVAEPTYSNGNLVGFSYARSLTSSSAANRVPVTAETFFDDLEGRVFTTADRINAAGLDGDGDFEYITAPTFTVSSSTGTAGSGVAVLDVTSAEITGLSVTTQPTGTPDVLTPTNSIFVGSFTPANAGAGSTPGGTVTTTVASVAAGATITIAGGSFTSSAAIPAANIALSGNATATGGTSFSPNSGTVQITGPATLTLSAGSTVTATTGNVSITTNTVVTNPTPGAPATALGERFRTIGGPVNFEVFSGLNYVRDVNYGTGIELE